MRRWLSSLAITFIASFVATGMAQATTCSAYPYTLANGNTADATQVMSNFTSILTCANSSLAPIADPIFVDTSAGAAVIRAQGNTNGFTLLADGYSGGNTQVNFGIMYSVASLMLGWNAKPNGSSTGYVSSQGIYAAKPVAVELGDAGGSPDRAFALLANDTSATRTLGSAVTMATLMTVLTNGSVGIGNTSPNAKLEINTSIITSLPTEYSTIVNSNFAGVNGGGGRDDLILANGGTDPTTGIRGSALAFKAPTWGSTGSFSSGRILSYFDTSAGSNPGYTGALLALQYPTADNTFTTGLVLGNGNVGIGTTSPARSLQVVGDIRVGTTGTNGCVENFAGTALIGICSSDASLKIVTGTVSGLADRFSKLQLVHFRWNEASAALYHTSLTTLNTGFIAQSVERLFPELVSKDRNGYRQLDYTTLTLYGLETIKELKSVSDVHAEALSSLKARSQEQAAAIDRLQKANAALAASSRAQSEAIRELHTEVAALDRQVRIRTARN